ncbi:MAG: hypothetical protein Q4D62_07300 [Planctomycetia bacterium]|nr:hypothetical protein [Planctomycetia bacterium]
MKHRHLIQGKSFKAFLWHFPLFLLLVDGILAAGVGFYYLFVHHLFIYTMLIGLVCSLVAYAVVCFLASRLATPELFVPEEEYWSNGEKEAFARVREYVQGISCDTLDWKDANTYFQVIQDVARQAASFYHPQKSQPELDVPLSQLTLITRQVAYDLHEKLDEIVPGTHLVTLKHLLYAKSFYTKTPSVYNTYRTLAFLLNPAMGILREGRAQLYRQVSSSFLQKHQTMLLRYGLELIGHYAVELYSGRLRHEMQKEKRQPLSQPVTLWLAASSPEVEKDFFERHFTGADWKSFPDSTSPHPLFTVAHPEWGRFQIVRAEEEGTLKKSFFSRKPTLQGPWEQLCARLEEVDVVVLIHDVCHSDPDVDRAIMEAFQEWKKSHSHRTPPLCLVVLVGKEVSETEKELVETPFVLSEADWVLEEESPEAFFQILCGFFTEIERIQEARQLSPHLRQGGIRKTAKQVQEATGKLWHHFWSAKDRPAEKS